MKHTPLTSSQASAAYDHEFNGLSKRQLNVLRGGWKGNLPRGIDFPPPCEQECVMFEKCKKKKLACSNFLRYVSRSENVGPPEFPDAKKWRYDLIFPCGENGENKWIK